MGRDTATKASGFTFTQRVKGISDHFFFRCDSGPGIVIERLAPEPNSIVSKS